MNNKKFRAKCVLQDVGYDELADAIGVTGSEFRRKLKQHDFNAVELEKMMRILDFKDVNELNSIFFTL